MPQSSGFGQPYGMPRSSGFGQPYGMPRSSGYGQPYGMPQSSGYGQPSGYSQPPMYQGMPVLSTNHVYTEATLPKVGQRVWIPEENTWGVITGDGSSGGGSGPMGGTPTGDSLFGLPPQPFSGPMQPATQPAFQPATKPTVRANAGPPRSMYETLGVTNFLQQNDPYSINLPGISGSSSGAVCTPGGT